MIDKIDYLKRRLSMNENDRFPVLGRGPKEYIPIDILKEHEKQVLLNHGNELIEPLKQHRGLTYCEIWAIINDVTNLDNVSENEAKENVWNYIMKYYGFS